jgi:hypothetical protein
VGSALSAIGPTGLGDGWLWIMRIAPVWYEDSCVDLAIGCWDTHETEQISSIGQPSTWPHRLHLQ